MYAVTVAHNIVPGRTRFRVQLSGPSHGWANYLEQHLGQLPEVCSATANPLTGSVLVNYDPARTSTVALRGLIEGLLARLQPSSNATSPGQRSNRKRPGVRQDAVAHPATLRGGSVAASRRQGPRVLALKTTPLAAAGAVSKAKSPAAYRSTLIRSRARNIEAAPTLPWHNWEAETVARHFQVLLDHGLTPQQAMRRLQQYGSNEVPDIPRRSRTAILLDQVVSIPPLMLGVAGIFSFLTGAALDAFFIIGALVANTALGFCTEEYAEQTIQSLRQTRPPEATVRRAARSMRIPLQHLVPGDILLLAPGQVVAADGRVLRAENLTLDESLLTGESVGQLKTAASLPPQPPQRGRSPALPITERTNMVYAGSAVIAGHGEILVTATGLSTELGRISTLIGAASDTPPPMSRELHRLGGTLALIATGLCGLFALVGILQGMPALAVLALSASLAVSAIPEGLPTVATTTLALGLRHLRQHNVVIRRLPVVAALGSATVLCVDKTGTLTQNRMSARCFVLDDDEIETVQDVPDGVVREASLHCVRQGQVLAPQDDALLRLALQVGALCTEAELRPLSHGAWSARGSGTEQALLLAAAACLDMPQLQEQFTLRERVPRSAGHNYMVSIHDHPGGPAAVFIKGAPEEVLNLCTHEHTRRGKTLLTGSRRQRHLDANARLASRGLRVLGLAVGMTSPGATWTERPDRLEWIGLVGLEDPLRSEARTAIKQLAGAGIRTLLLTGDQAHTAAAIGQAVGLGQTGKVYVATASAIQDCLTSGRPLPDVLARVSPQHKFDIVQLLQQRGEVVIMTGDGINDAPALKAADVGVAMGTRSAQLARDLAGMILLDDNLLNLPRAVAQGRTIYTNIRKALRFLLASNIADIGLAGACLLLNLAFPLTALQLLWMNLISDVFPAIALAMEPAATQVMQAPPRPPGEPLMTRSLWQMIAREAAAIAAAALGSYLWGVGRYGLGARARTVTFTTITLSEIIYALACRSERPRPLGKAIQPNRYLASCLGISAAAQVATVVFPPLRLLLGTTPLSWLDWLIVTAASSSVFGTAEMLKRLPSGTNSAPQKMLPAPKISRINDSAPVL